MTKRSTTQGAKKKPKGRRPRRPARKASATRRAGPPFRTHKVLAASRKRVAQVRAWFAPLTETVKGTQCAAIAPTATARTSRARSLLLEAEREERLAAALAHDDGTLDPGERAAAEAHHN